MAARMIEVEGLVKTYGFRGEVLAVDRVSFSVGKGDRFGLLGANGAGKTSVLRILATVLAPTEGSARVGGYDVLGDRREARSLVGYMPQDLDLREWASGAAYLHFWARMTGLSASERKRRVASLVEQLGLTGQIEGDPLEYTIGVQKRLSLAQALLSDPDVLLLDEPMTGLADVGREFFVDQFERFVAEEKTVVLSSPLLADVRAACDRVTVMSDGQCTEVFEVADLLNRIGEGKDARVFVDCDPLSSKAVAALRKMDGVVDVRSTPTATIVYIIPREAQVEALREALEGQGVQVRKLRPAQLKLGDVFNTLYT